MRYFSMSIGLGPILVLALAAASPGDSSGAPIELVNVPIGATRAESNGDSLNVRGSADLRFLVFDSRAENLVVGDTNRRRDVFLKDAQNNTMTLLSRAGPNAANGDSSGPDITPSGDWIVFASKANNLVAGDTNDQQDIFLFERTSGAMTRIVPAVGIQPNGPSKEPRISANGRRIVFLSGASNWNGADSNGFDDVFVHDVDLGTTVRASVSVTGSEVGDLPPSSPQISPDGACVSFDSASSLVLPGDWNFSNDVFVHHLATAATVRVSVGNAGQELMSVSRGRHLLLDCHHTIYHGNHFSGTPGVDIGFLQNVAGAVSEVPSSVPFTGNAPRLAISANRRWLALADDDMNGVALTQVIDLQTPSVRQMTDGWGAPGAVSDNGSAVVSTTIRPIQSVDRNATQDVVIRSTTGNPPIWISNTGSEVSPPLAANADSGRGFGIYGAALPTWHRRHHAISGTGRFVAFSSSASNLVAGDTNGVEDVFVRDRTLGITVRASVDASGNQLAEPSAAADISGSGRQVLMESCATLGLPDTNNVCDIYLRDLDSGLVEKINVATGGSDANGVGNVNTGHWPRMSADARYVVFRSQATSLVGGTTGAASRIYVRDRTLGTTRSLGSGSRPYITRHGRFIVFVLGNSVQVHDQTTDVTASLVFPGGDPDGVLDWPTISDDGRYVVFYSSADNLVANDNDTDGVDVFLHDRNTNTTTLVSIETPLTAGSGGAIAEISPDGEWIAWLPDLVLATQTADARGFLTHRVTGDITAFVGEDRIHQGQDYLTRPRFSADSRTLVFGANGLSRTTVDGNADLNDIFVTPVDAGHVFGDGFE